MQRIPMTKSGFERLKKDLHYHVSVLRPQNIKDIEEARAHGDLSENAEYHAAKEKQSLIAAQITQLEDKLARAEVIDPKEVRAEKVVFGATVTVYDVENEQDLKYQIVGDVETDVKNNKIGISSPMARALIGKRLDDQVFVNTPKGRREFCVVKIEYI